MALKLNYKEFGAGPPLIILHGLFGSLDNWQTIAKRLAEDFTVFILDLRNHGRSPHSREHSYALMCEDLLAFMEEHWVFETALLGHSMGGKLAMYFALHQADKVEKLVVVDIAPKAYPGGHEIIFQALLNLPLEEIHSRKEAEAWLAGPIISRPVRQFLLKNLGRDKAGRFFWKPNIEVLHRQYHEILREIGGDDTSPFDKPTLFIRGGRSGYILDEDVPEIKKLFPAARFHTIPETGHWVHAEAPDEFVSVVKGFLLEPEKNIVE